MKIISLLLLLLLAMLMLYGCSLIPAAGAEPSPDPLSLLYTHPPGHITQTPFQPRTNTPLPTPPPTNTPLPPTYTPTLSPTPTITPTPSETPFPTRERFTQRANWPPEHFGSPGPTAVTAIPSPFPMLDNREMVNILLAGSDRRATGSYRTDTLIIVSIRPRDGVVTLISLPRDLFVYIPGWTMQRINAAYLHGEVVRYPGGGEGLLKDTILYNLGIPIEHVAMVEFNGFMGIVDTLGGVDIPMVCSYTDWRMIDPELPVNDPKSWELYTVGPGIVRMDGELALWYARSRLKSSDFDRGRRQQEILRAMFQRGLQLDMIPRIPDLYSQMRHMIQTDMSLSTILELAPLALKMDSAQIRSYYLNTGNKTVIHWTSPTGAYTLLPNPPVLQPMLDEALSAPNPEAANRLDVQVEVWNGTNNSGWDVLAAERLHYAGYHTELNPADRRNYQESLLYDFTLEQDVRKSRAMLNALGLPTSALVAAPGEADFQYRLVVGRDYNPCFRPPNYLR
jgi:polyisoprenyl-teichoic acid--peptidoglycan teichoic acid transferase